MPTKNEETAKADNLAVNGLTPIISAAMSMSLIAIQLRPKRPRVRLRAIQAKPTAKPKQNRYPATGVA